MSEDHDWWLVYRPATLVFRTVHHDKAGETSDFRVVEAEIADVDASRNVLLITREMIPVQFPIGMLFPVHPENTPPESQSYIGGQELTRDFHPQVGAERTTLRFLDRREVERLLASVQPASPKKRRRGK